MTESRPTPILRTMTLGEAGPLWLARKETWKRLRPKTLETNRSYLKALTGFFGESAVLSDFHAGSFRAFQTARAKTAGPSTINHELNALGQMLRLGECWGGIADFYSPLKEPEWEKPKTFTFEQQQHIFAAASGDPELELAELVFTVTRNTSASGTELRLARIKQLDLESSPPRFQVTAETAKNLIRPRLLPLNPAAERAFRRIHERANRLGAHFPDDFLFPRRVGPGKYDPARPASKEWLRHQTRVLRERTGIKHIRPHLWRHQLATELLEQGVPAETVRGTMGWVSERMIATYSHTRLDAKLKAFDVLERVSPDPPAAAPDLLNPAIQAEIDRRVAEAVAQAIASLQPQRMPSNVVSFPGGAR